MLDGRRHGYTSSGFALTHASSHRKKYAYTLMLLRGAFAENLQRGRHRDE